MVGKKFKMADLSFYVNNYHPPDEVGRRVLASPRMSVRLSVTRPDVRISFPEQNSVTRTWISLIFDTHPLGGVHVPFGVFEILPA